jgi:hypothetical protein
LSATQAGPRPWREGPSRQPWLILSCQIASVHEISSAQDKCARQLLAAARVGAFTFVSFASLMQRVGTQLRILQAQSHSRSRTALRSIGRSAARAEDRHESLICTATHCAVWGLHCTNVRRARIAFVALVASIAFFALLPRSTLRSLRTLCAGLALRAGYPLNALRALGTRRALRTGLTFRTRIPAATSQNQGQANERQC